MGKNRLSHDKQERLIEQKEWIHELGERDSFERDCAAGPDAGRSTIHLSGRWHFAPAW